MKAKLAQANFLLALAFSLLVVISCAYFLLFKKLDKGHIDGLLVKSLSSFINQDNIRYKSSDLKIRNYITYTVYGLSLKNQYVELYADEMRFDIPFLALFSRRRIRSQIKKLDLYISKLQKEESQVKISQKNKTLENELSVQIQEINISQKGLTYQLKDTYLRNINHPYYTTLRTYIDLSGQSERQFGLEFWGELKFEDIFNQRINLNGFVKVKSNDLRFRPIVGRQIRVRTDKEVKNLFLFSQQSGRGSLEFKMQLKSDVLKFYEINLAKINLDEIPKQVLSLVGCEKSNYSIQGEILWDKFSESWKPMLDFEGNCQKMKLAYDEGKYTWRLISRDQNYPHVYIESSEMNLEKVEEIRIDIKNENLFDDLSFIENIKKIKSEVINELPSIAKGEYLKIIVYDALKETKNLGFSNVYKVVFKNKEVIKEEVYLKKGESSLYLFIKDKILSISGKSKDVKILEYLSQKSFSFIKRASLIEFDLNNLKKELVLKLHKGKLDLDVFKKEFGKSLDLIMLGSNDRLEIKSNDMRKYNFDIFKGKL